MGKEVPSLDLESAKGLFEKYSTRAQQAPNGAFFPQRLPEWSKLTALAPAVAGPFLSWLVRRFNEPRGFLNRESTAHHALIQHWLGNAAAFDQQHFADAIDALPRHEDNTLSDGEIRAVLRSLGKMRKKGRLGPELTATIGRLPEVLFRRNQFFRQQEHARRKEWVRQLRLFGPASVDDSDTSTKTTRRAPNIDAEQLWSSFLSAAEREGGARPSATFARTTETLIHELGSASVLERCHAFIDAYVRDPNPTTQRFGGDAPELNLSSEAVRGCVWAVGSREDSAEHCRRLATLALAALKVVDWGTLRSLKLANACIRALADVGTGDAVNQLAWLKTRVKQKPVQKEIAAAMGRCAVAASMTVADLEEVGAPRFGFDTDGVRRESFGDYVLTLRIDADGVGKSWSNAAGQPLKSPPTKAMREHRTPIKELIADAKDAERMLASHKRRLDSLFVEERSWPLAQFRERYLSHPLLRPLASRLVWSVGGTSAIFQDGAPTDVRGRKVVAPPEERVMLWHPFDAAASVDEVLAWRARLAQLGITQPFKQAHREVYVLTDAERRTGEYSNRFAAHVIRQSQFRTLAGHRGWQTKLLGPWDGGDHAIATRELPGGLRGEFWVGALDDPDALGDNGWLYLATDRVRFITATAAGGDPVSLDRVPRKVFSEVMRDVDLFVGVASVGNDPTWQDGGPQGRYRTYWERYSFGELGATASTRREVLESLVPRLRIRDRVSFADRFLVVRGDLRTYKIHLGSANILMEPNDQYLCIVPARGTAATAALARHGKDELFLPFEGDATLSVILSKAFMLADDAKITDPTILSQIGRG